MRPAPVRLDHYQLSRLALTPVESYSPNFDEGLYPRISDANFDVRVGLKEREEDDGHFLIELRLRGAPKEGGNFPYEFEIEAQGFVQFVGKEPDPKTLRDLVLVNGAAMLYSALREVLLSLSMRFPNGPMMLPSVSFLDLRNAKNEISATKDVTTEPPETGKPA